jgi:hypothetical protein
VKKQGSLKGWKVARGERAVRNDMPRFVSEAVSDSAKYLALNYVTSVRSSCTVPFPRI